MPTLKKDTAVPLIRVPSVYKFSKLPGLKWLLVVLPLAYIMILMVFSILGLFKQSFFNENGFTLEYYSQIFSHSVYLQVIWLTIKIAFLVTLFCLILAYPVAYLLTKIQTGFWKKLILGVVLVPFWISLLVRSFAWTIILQNNGVINQFLMGIGIIDKPLPLLYNTVGVVIGMTHILVPYMILSLYSIMSGIDSRLLQAAEGMGAKPWKAFLQIFFPLSLPGVLAGSLIVFVLSLGYFITPALLGGANNMMISMLIQDNIINTLNWHLAAALAVTLFVITVLLLVLAYFIIRNTPLFKEVV